MFPINPSSADLGYTNTSRCLRRALASALLTLTVFCLGCPPEGDDDGDGIGRAWDLCPETTPHGAERRFLGCSISDLILQPEVLTDRLQEQMDALTAPFSDEPILDEAILSFVAAQDQYGTARDALRQVEPCDAAQGFQDAESSLGYASQTMDLFLEELQVMPHQGPVPEGDVDEISSELLWWRARGAELSELIADAGEASEVVQAMCDELVSAEQIEGVVEEIDPRRRSFVLRGGQRIVMAAVALYDQAVTEGVSVSSDVLRFQDGTTVAVWGSVSWDLVTALPGIWDGECLQLTALPWGVQYAANGLDPVAYRDAGAVHQFERGMRLGATGPNCPVKDSEKPWMKYGFEIVVTQGSKVITMASSLQKGQDAYFPSNLDPKLPANLTVQKHRFRCEKDPLSIIGASKCQFDVVISTVYMTIQVNERFAFCDTIYEDTVFSLPPNDPTAFESTRVMGFTGAPSPATFHAEARKLVNGQPGSVQPIQALTPFAVKRTDSLGLHGTNRSSAIRWPHIIGTRNGQPYRYACSVPELVRDRLAACQGGPDSFYRLPFAHGQSTFVGQGNNTPWDGIGDAPSHTMTAWQRWALDLDDPIGTDLMAAREGVVRDMVDGSTVRCISGKTVPGNMDCPSFFGNYLAIEHAGGEWSWYMHMDPGSATAANVFKGKRVSRGQKIGEVGLTGNTFASHVHFQVTPGNSTSATNQASYEFYTSSALSNPASCAVPQAGQTVWSNNAP